MSIKNIHLSNRTYDLIKKYVDIIQSQDNLSKSFDDRILDLLRTEVSLSNFRRILDIIKHFISDFYNPSDCVHLLLQESTIDTLYVYCFRNGYWTLDKGLYRLIEKAINKIHRDNLEKEYLEVISP